jgi:hypothetical protein
MIKKILMCIADYYSIFKKQVLIYLGDFRLTAVTSWSSPHNFLLPHSINWVFSFFCIIDYILVLKQLPYLEMARCLAIQFLNDP